MANWADLPHDLLLRISDFYIAPDFIVRMQSTCKSWRSILKGSIHHELPWLMMLPNNKEEDADARDFFSLSKKKMHTILLPEMRGKRCCGSFQNGWLMTVDEKLNICLFHPWSKKKFDLPHQSTFKNQPFEVEDYSMEEIRDRDIRKAALSDDGKVVVVIYGVGSLAFCRIGDEVYTEIESGIGADAEDVIYHKGQFYTLSVVYDIYILHIEEGNNPHGEKLTEKLEFNPLASMVFGYLVPDVLTDSMFVIIRDINLIQHTSELDTCLAQTCHFRIYGVTLEEGAQARMLKKFEEVESLGDRTLFLGHNSSIVVMASQFPGFKGNRIYFADDYMEHYCANPYGCRDLGVYSLEEGTVEELFIDRFHPIQSPPLWIATPPYSSQRDFGGQKLCLEE
ncbi:hypothetical protein MRB53_022060 [Persea americana]|uniref:Uncharacterized protein n=1 Tax=Persea americana TaxID=3435 RepID=A0ACC2L5J2_PERAE|nr:hypothetical protein MRB53_022060 [Persea americana]